MEALSVMFVYKEQNAYQRHSLFPVDILAFTRYVEGSSVTLMELTTGTLNTLVVIKKVESLNALYTTLYIDWI